MGLVCKCSSCHRAGLDLQRVSSSLLDNWCRLLSLCVLLQISSVQPWFHLIQFPSNLVAAQTCPLSFLHPRNFFIFDFSPLLTTPPLLPTPLFASANSAVNSALHSCSSPFPPCLLLTSSSLLSSPCQSALWCGDRWCVLDLVMSPSPLPHSRLYWPITSPHSLSPLFSPLLLTSSRSLTNLASFLLPNPIFWHLPLITFCDSTHSASVPPASQHCHLTFFPLRFHSYLCYPVTIWTFSVNMDFLKSFSHVCLLCLYLRCVSHFFPLCFFASCYLCTENPPWCFPAWLTKACFVYMCTFFNFGGETAKRLIIRICIITQSWNIYWMSTHTRMIWLRSSVACEFMPDGVLIESDGGHKKKPSS